MKQRAFLLLTALALTLWGTACSRQPSDGKTRVRVGHFPNVTHVQALVAHQLTRQGKGWFEERLGPDVVVEWYTYNAGPNAMEAIFAGSIDLSYVGPSPAINAFARAKGEEIRLVAGAAEGGAALVVQKDSELKTAADFRGKKIATPQFGNTQDIAARAWLIEGGLKITQLGGDAQVIPTANPDQLLLFNSKRVDGVWTVEPWVSRLQREAGGEILVDEKDAVTTILVSSVDFASKQRERLDAFVKAHEELTQWIIDNPEEAQRLVVAELEAITHSKINPDLIAAAWPRLILTSEINLSALQTYVDNARKVGFLQDVPDLKRLLLPPSL